MQDVTNAFIEEVLSNEESNGLDEDANTCLVSNDENQDVDIQITTNGTASAYSKKSEQGCTKRNYFLKTRAIT